MSDSENPSAATPSDLVQADHYDFLPGEELWVRGRPARCVRFDYPHVYWQFTDDQAVLDAASAPNEGCAEKHRSVSCTPHLFQVRAARKRGPPTSDEDAMHDDEDEEEHDTQRPMEDSSDEDEERERAAAEALRQQQGEEEQQAPEQPAQPEEPSSDAADADSDADPQAGLLSAFARLQPKVLFRGITDESSATRIALRPSQSAEIEECSRARFQVPGKVAAITMLKCEDVELEFLGCISQLNLIQCRRCIVRCTQSCATYTIDDSQDCQILFPSYQSQVLVVSTNSSGCVLRAVPGGNPPPEDGDANDESEEKSRALEHEVEHVLDQAAAQVAVSQPPMPEDALHIDAAGEAAGAEAPVAPEAEAPDAVTQYRTTWSNETATFSTERLVRQGQLGYWQ